MQAAVAFQQARHPIFFLVLPWFHAAEKRHLVHEDLRSVTPCLTQKNSEELLHSASCDPFQFFSGVDIYHAGRRHLRTECAVDSDQESLWLYRTNKNNDLLFYDRFLVDMLEHLLWMIKKLCNIYFETLINWKNCIKQLLWMLIVYLYSFTSFVFIFYLKIWLPLKIRSESLIFIPFISRGGLSLISIISWRRTFVYMSCLSFEGHRAKTYSSGFSTFSCMSIQVPKKNSCFNNQDFL